MTELFPETQFYPNQTSEVYREELRDYVVCGVEGSRNVAFSERAFSRGRKSEQVPVATDTMIPAALKTFFADDFDIKINKLSDLYVEFDLIGVDVSIANALRRIMIAEVPSCAIDTVHIWQNTGAIQDEVLAHRLGLIPFVVDMNAIEFRKDTEELSEANSVKLSLHVKCTKETLEPGQKFLPVYAKNFKFEAWSAKQKAAFASTPPRPAYPNILITKLRPGQEIELKGFLQKGIGMTHTKWSPVCTASYRLQPEFELSEEKPFSSEEARELKKICPMGVFDIEEAQGTVKVVVEKPRNCTTCRVCLERFPSQILLKKRRSHFIFSVESTGVFPAEQIVRSAIQILYKKVISNRESLARHFAED